jgi:hypothetical protein
MEKWFDFNLIIDGLSGTPIHTIAMDSHQLEELLGRNGFTVFHIQGENIVSEDSFFDEAAASLHWPEYFGRGWSAWDDGLVEFTGLATEKTAIVWNHADLSFHHDAQTFLQACIDLYNMALSLSIKPSSIWPGMKPKQVEIFLLGEEGGFRQLFMMKKDE